MQIVFNILITAAQIAVIALSFSLIYVPGRFFNISHAGIFTAAPYLTYLFFVQFSYPFLVSLTFSLIIICVIAIMLEALVFRRLRKTTSPMVLLIASIGVYVIIENTISLIWGNSILSIRDQYINVGYSYFGGYISGYQKLIIGYTIIVIVTTLLIFNRTKLGKEIRAVSSNMQLAILMGVNYDRVLLFTFVAGSLIVGLAGIIISLDINLSPGMGFNLLILGIVAMIIGGHGSFTGLIFGSIIISIAQHLSSLYISSKWMNAIAYLILIGLLIWKPLGLSGKQLKKTEI